MTPHTAVHRFSAWSAAVFGLLILLLPAVPLWVTPAGAQTESGFVENIDAGRVRTSEDTKFVAQSAAAESLDEFDVPEEFETYRAPVADPLAPFNRAMFVFNDRLYFWVLKPTARGYNTVVPEAGRQGVRNFFNNLFAPVRVANCILQGKGNAAADEIARFVTNSIIGVLGFADPASDLYQIPSHEEDFGQTLGAWGFGNGFYIVWPFLGSSTLRDSAGWVGDALYTNPLFYLDDLAWTIGIGAYRRFNDLSLRIGEYEAIKEAAIEPYEAVRDGYIQFRSGLVNE